MLDQAEILQFQTNIKLSARSHIVTVRLNYQIMFGPSEHVMLESRYQNLGLVDDSMREMNNNNNIDQAENNIIESEYQIVGLVERWICTLKS